MRKEMLFSLAVLGPLMTGCDYTFPEDLAASFEERYPSTSFEDCGSEMVDPECTGAPVSSPFTCFAEKLATCTPAKISILRSPYEGSLERAIYMIVPQDTPTEYCIVEQFVDYSNGSIRGGIASSSGGGDANELKCVGVQVSDDCKDPVHTVVCEDICPPNTNCVYLSE